MHAATFKFDPTTLPPPRPPPFPRVDLFDTCNDDAGDGGGFLQFLRSRTFWWLLMVRASTDTKRTEQNARMCVLFMVGYLKGLSLFSLSLFSLSLVIL
jgi:hypothetical protein